MFSERPIIACVKVGTRYTANYVNRLYAGVCKHTQHEFDFVCLTDDSKGITCDFEAIETDLKNWWAKLVLFKPQTCLRGRRVIFLDLDTVITGPIDFLFSYKGNFAILRDLGVPTGLGSAIMSIAPWYGTHIWTAFAAQVVAAMQQFWGDQEFIATQVLRTELDLWQELAPGRIVSYKLTPGVSEGRLPLETSIVCFHGDPKPHEIHEAQAPAWFQENWLRICG